MYRILIVDDEETIRNGLKNYLRKNIKDFEVIDTAKNGNEAIQKARLLLPDVIITDIVMPHMNGIDFLENVMCFLPDTKIIILSGYDKFDYAKEAIRLGVKGYLVKPIDTTALQKLLQEIKDILDRERYDWQQEKKEKVQKQVLNQLCGNSYLCGLIRGEGDKEKLLELLKKKFKNEIEVVFQEMQGEEVLIFCFINEQVSDTFVRINTRLTSVSNYMRKEGEGEFHFFLGGMVKDYESLQDSFQQAKSMLEAIFTDHVDAVFNYMDYISGQATECLPLPEAFVRELIYHVNYGEKESLNKKVDELFEMIRDEKVITANYFRRWIASIMLQIISAAKESKISYLEEERIGDAIMNACSMRKLQQVFLDALFFLMEKKRKSNQRTLIILEKVDFLIKENMNKPDFSLDDVANQLFISPNYLRQIIKKETGITFVEYLTRERMKRAKYLLSIKEILVSEVAELVGYKDPRYFSVCFKKMYQISPSEFIELKKT